MPRNNYKEPPYVPDFKRQPDPDFPGPVKWNPQEWVVVGGDNGGGLYGQVQDGSGNTYTVQTFSSGPDGAPDDPPIQVRILQIADSETIPVGTWIGPIATGQDANGNDIGWTQVPIWLDSGQGGGQGA